MPRKKLALVPATSEPLDASALAAAVAQEEVDLSEDHLALLVTEHFGRSLLFCAETSKWYRFDGHQFAPDATHEIFDLVRGVVRDATEAAPRRVRSRVRSAATIAGITRLLSTDRMHAVTVADLDPDPWLLNTPAGVVDLQTGTERPNAPGDRCTLSTRVAPAPVGTRPERWLRFLAEVTQGDTALAAFLHRWAGYTLTGSTREHAATFLFGQGQNGKSLFIDTLVHVLGSYAITAPISTFAEAKHDQHPTAIARLRGARLVATTETDATRRWDDARLKTLTGGDRLAARFMRQDFFEFDPRFKLLVAGNSRPRFGVVDFAIRRRVHIVPFDFRPAEPDVHLSETLHREAPGILRWCLEGTSMWLRDGLAPPEAVRVANEDFAEAADAIGQWLSEATTRDVDATTLLAHVFMNWRIWAESRNERVGTARQLSEDLARREFKKIHTREGAAFLGIALRPPTFGGAP